MFFDFYNVKLLLFLKKKKKLYIFFIFEINITFLLLFN